MMGRNYTRKIAAHRGFSLIELLMVISIISLITSIIVASLITSREKAREARAKVELRQIMEAIVVATGENNSTLVGITFPGHLYPDNPSSTVNCQAGEEIQPYVGSACRTAWKETARKIAHSTDGLYVGDQLFISFEFDPWGVPYLVYEKQGLEEQESSCGTQDEIRSAGRDRTPMTQDDVIMLIPLSGTCP